MLSSDRRGQILLAVFPRRVMGGLLDVPCDGVALTEIMHLSEELQSSVHPPLI